MKTFVQLFSILILICYISLQTSAQKSATYDFEFKVDRILKPLSISATTLANAKSIKDLNKHFPETWVKSYISVEVSATINGKSQKVIGSDALLTEKQKKLLASADTGSDIAINIRYLPENQLLNNKVREFPFSFMVNPHQSASFKSGYNALIDYLKENAIDKIPDDTFTGLNLAIIKFTIDENGNVINSLVFESSKNSKADEILLNAINNMPSWKPAEYFNGIKTIQEFAFTVGNMKNCMINVLNIDEGIE